MGREKSPTALSAATSACSRVAPLSIAAALARAATLANSPSVAGLPANAVSGLSAVNLAVVGSAPAGRVASLLRSPTLGTASLKYSTALLAAASACSRVAPLSIAAALAFAATLAASPLVAGLPVNAVSGPSGGSSD